MTKRTAGSLYIHPSRAILFSHQSKRFEECWWFLNINSLDWELSELLWKIIADWIFNLDSCLADSSLSFLGSCSQCRLNVDSQSASWELFTALFVVDVAEQHPHSSALKLCGVWNRSVLPVKLYLPRAEKNCTCSGRIQMSEL